MTFLYRTFAQWFVKNLYRLGQAFLMTSATILSLTLVTAHAEPGFPKRPVKVIVPFPAGTSPDNVMRILSQRLSAIWEQPVVIENKPGAAGNIGAVAVANSPADGYTLLYAVNSIICSNPHIYKTRFDPLKELTPISEIVTMGYVLLARPNLGVASMADLIKLAKAEPGKLTYGSSGQGGGNHIAMELFLNMTGTKMLHIPMTTNPALAVYSGETDLNMSPYTTGVPAAKGGKAKALGVTLASSLDALPGVAAISETVPGYVADVWHGVFAPAGTPTDITHKISADLTKVLAEPEIRKRLKEIGLETVGNSPAEFSSLVKRDYEKWGRIIHSVNIKLE